MALEAVFLDAGDTLLRERLPRWEIYAQAARARGVDVAPERMRELMVNAHCALPLVLDGAYRYSDLWFRAYIARIFGAELGLSRQSVAEITAELFERFEDAYTFELFPGAFELLDELRARGVTVGVVSNWSARLPRVLRAVGLAERLDFVVCSALERTEKPEPAIFRLALARAGVAPERALHAGDHPTKDAGGARELGIAAVLVDHAGTLRPEEAGDVAVVGGLAQLGSYILGRLA